MGVQRYPLNGLTGFGRKLLKEVESATAHLFSDDAWHMASALYLVAGEIIGYHAVKISKATGLPRDECVWMGMRLRSAGALRRGRIASDWSDKQAGDINFVIDAMLAAGTLKKKGRGGNARIALRSRAA